MNFQVSPLNYFGKRYEANDALVVVRLNVPETKVNLEELRDKRRHLSELELREVSGESQVALPLGSDGVDLIVPQEIRQGPKMDWTITGRIYQTIWVCDTQSTKLTW